LLRCSSSFEIFDEVARCLENDQKLSVEFFGLFALPGIELLDGT
jgi:hypothetical protein